MPSQFPLKAPGDRLDHAFDFTDDLQQGETLTGDPTIMCDPTGLTITPIGLQEALVVVWIEDGAPQTGYELTCAIGTSEGRTLVGKATLNVGAVGLDDASAVTPLD